MRIDPTPHGAATPPSRTGVEEQPGVTRVLADLEGAGLLCREIHDDGDISFTLTMRGRRAARQMAMSRDSHALVLLGALVGTDHRVN